MSTEPTIDTCYIEVLRRRELYHTEKRLEFFDAARDAINDTPRNSSLLRQSEYHRGCEQAVSEIIKELVAPDESEGQS